MNETIEEEMLIDFEVYNLISLFSLSLFANLLNVFFSSLEL